MTTVECDGCGRPTPRRTGDKPGEGSYGEWLTTPLGDCFHRTHWDRSCVLASRAKVHGHRIDERMSDTEKLAR